MSTRRPRHPNGRTVRSKPAFFLDLDHPGRARHRACFRKAGIDPIAAGYPPGGTICWMCELIARAYLGANGRRVRLLAVQRVGPFLLRAGQCAFKLARIIRSATGSGVVNRSDLEVQVKAALRSHRNAWEEAKQEDGKLEYLDYASLYIGRDTADDPGRWLATDPTQAVIVCVAQLEQCAGRLVYLSRLIRDETRVQMAKTVKREGETADGFRADLLAKYPVDLQCLVRTVLALRPEYAPYAAQGGNPNATDDAEAFAEAESRLYQAWRTQRSRQRAAPHFDDAQATDGETKNVTAKKRKIRRNKT